ncbi:MAG: DUF6691 family protein [Polyangiales bacterium]
MKERPQGLFVAFLSGLLFATGLGIAGMTQPSKIIGFLDFAGAWDPSLAFVMLGAVSVSFLANRRARARSAPLYAPKFEWPTRKDIDLRLVSGSALFGIGWGLGGFCPGPGVVSAARGGLDALTFVGAMLIATAITARVERAQAERTPSLSSSAG